MKPSALQLILKSKGIDLTQAAPLGGVEKVEEPSAPMPEKVKSNSKGLEAVLEKMANQQATPKVVDKALREAILKKIDRTLMKDLFKMF